jgi:hypothetical protein
MEIFKKYWFVLVVIVVVIALYIAIRKGVTDMFSGKSDEQKLAEEELGKLEYNSKNLTITTSDAILIAQQLLSAMDQYGTDEKTIVDLLDGLNRDDLMFLIKIFGIKKYNGVGEAMGLDSFIYAQNLNLAGWLKSELSGKELDKVAAMFANFKIPF